MVSYVLWSKLKMSKYLRDIPLYVYADKFSNELKKKIVKYGDENIRVRRNKSNIEVSFYEGPKSDKKSIFDSEVEKEWAKIYNR